jgi:fermentation-respiration switch protein FrsA (DUF1100 family)
LRWRPEFRRVLVIATLAAVTWLAVQSWDSGVIGWLERRLIYYPTFDVAHPLSVFGPGAEEVWFGQENHLHGVFVPGPSNRTLVFFHGNGGNLSHRAPLFNRMQRELGLNLFIFDYQGYGQSRGRPSEAATAADARAALVYLKHRPGIDASQFIYYGESLGGAVAIDLAAVAPPSALIVQSTFTSLAEMTRLHYPGLSFLLPFARSRYDSLSIMPLVRSPLLVVHGEADTLVPPEHGRRLLDAANEPKRLLMIPSASHNDVIVQGGPAYWQALRDFLRLPAPAHP